MFWRLILHSLNVLQAVSYPMSRLRMGNIIVNFQSAQLLVTRKYLARICTNVMIIVQVSKTTLLVSVLVTAHHHKSILRINA